MVGQGKRFELIICRLVFVFFVLLEFLQLLQLQLDFEGKGVAGWRGLEIV